MAIEVMAKVWKHANASGGELLVLLALADFSNEKVGGAWPSIDTLAKKSRLSERQTQYVIKQLEKKGLIRIEYNKGPRGTNVYYVMDEGEAHCTGEKTAGVQSDAKGGASHCTQTVIEPLLVPTSKYRDPSEQQVCEYGKEIGLPVDECLKFMDHYKSNGWKVGKNPMKDWKAALRNWKRNCNKTYGNTNKNTGQIINPRNRGICRGVTDYGEAARRKLARQNEEVARQMDLPENKPPAACGC